MNSAIPKQFIELKGKPILMHTIEKFANVFPEIKIVIALAQELHQEWIQLCKTQNFNYDFQMAEGGETRFHSVKNGLMLVPDICIVGVHDAARPFVNSKTITNAFEIAEKKGNAIPVIPVSESLREVNNKNNKAVDRNKFFIVQTPQCFHSNLLRKAFLQEYRLAFTDDASVVEAIGEKINLIEGNIENMKITTPQDLIVAETMMNLFAAEAQSRKRS